MIKLKNLLRESYEEEKEKFFRTHYTGYIQSDAYERSEAEGGLKWLGDKNKYPLLLTKEMHGPYEVEFRQKDEDTRYCIPDDEDDWKYKKDADGNLIYMTPEEKLKRNLPLKDTMIVAFIDNKPIGFASNEFGTVGVWVEKKFQKLGIGVALMEKHIEQRPDIKSKKNKIGQMTPAGQSMTKSYFDHMNKKHGQNWWHYKN